MWGVQFVGRGGCSSWGVGGCSLPPGGHDVRVSKVILTARQIYSVRLQSVVLRS